MTRTTIAVVLAMLLYLAPAASARPADLGYPAYPTPEVTPQKVMPERITDHPFDATKVNPLVLEQESINGAGNQGVAQPASDVAPPADEDAPWLILALGIAAAALGAAAITVVVRSRTRAHAV